MIGTALGMGAVLEVPQASINIALKKAGEVGYRRGSRGGAVWRLPRRRGGRGKLQGNQPHTRPGQEKLFK